MNHKNVLSVLESVKINRFSVVCYFKCSKKEKSIVSEVPFEPYDGEIIITWQEMLLHPIRSYNKYYHTPIIIYANDSHETIVLKAFKKVASHFIWNDELQKYEYA